MSTYKELRGLRVKYVPTDTTSPSTAAAGGTHLAAFVTGVETSTKLNATEEFTGTYTLKTVTDS